LSGGKSFGRFAGSAMTWAVLLVLAGWSLWAFLRLGLG
jgi:hypothetical protein